MNAWIMIDLDRIHPVSDGQWHRVARLPRLPQPGEQITMLCGQVEEAEYMNAGNQAPAETCWRCDLAYRRQEGIAIRPDHPGLTGVVPPTPRPHHKGHS
jgi:hypothetical protein